MKQADGTVQERQDIEFLLMRTRYDGQAVRIDNPIGIMNTILPVNVRTYFLFDGEKTDTFARPEYADEVRYAIYRVLNLEVLERSKNHLANVARDLRSDLRGLATGELKTLVAQDVELRQQQTDGQQRQDELKKEIAAAKQHIEEVNQRLRDLDAVQALQKQYELYTAQMEERAGEFKSLVGRVRDLASQGYVMLIGDALTQAHSILDEKRQRGEIPSNIRQQFVQDLLDQQMCVCGRPFAAHDTAHEHLSQLLRVAVPSALEDDVLNTSGALRGLRDRGDEQRRLLDELMGEKARLQDALDRLYTQRDDITRQMEGSHSGEVSALALRRDEYQRDIDRYNEESLRAEMKLEGLRPSSNVFLAL